MTYFNILHNDVLLEIGVKLFNNDEIYGYHKLTGIDENKFYHYICNKLTDIFKGLPSECELNGRKFSWMKIAECLATMTIRGLRNTDTISILDLSMKRYDGSYDEFYKLMIYKFNLYPNFILATYIRRMGWNYFSCSSYIDKYVDNYVDDVLSRCKPLNFHGYTHGYTHVDEEGYLLMKHHKYYIRHSLYCDAKMDKMDQICSLSNDDIKRVKNKGYITVVDIVY